MKSLINNFLRGLLFVFPLCATLYILVEAIVWSNDVLNGMLYERYGIDIPGLGILTVFLAISGIGYLFSQALTRPLFGYFDRFMNQLPLVKIIYNALRELTEAFVGEKKRFNRPVLADFSMPDAGTVKRIGFITHQDLSELGATDVVAVYCPHSYNFSGALYLLPPSALTPIDANSADVMKYVISAGVTRISKPEE